MGKIEGMPSSRVFVVLLVFASVVVDLAVLVEVGDPREAGPLSFIAVALASSQVSLLAIWLALGNSPATLRLALGALGAWLWSVLLTHVVVWEVSHWSGLFLLQMVMVFTPLWLVRLAGWRIGLPPRTGDETAAVSVDGQTRSGQWTIRKVLLWMTVGGCLFGALRYLGAEHSQGELFRAWSGGLSSIIAMLAVWGLMLGTRPWLRILPLVAVALLGAHQMGQELQTSLAQRLGYYVLILTQAGCVSGALSVMRVGDVRIRRKTPAYGVQRAADVWEPTA